MTLFLAQSIVVNTSFKWGYAASQVLVSGTFTGWKDHIPLKRIGNEFTTIVVLAFLMITDRDRDCLEEFITTNTL
jgi:hypothetical protein